MNQQEIFDKISKHLLKQQKKSIDVNSKCKYHSYSAEGEFLACAVGCLIPREQYDPEMEDKNIQSNSILDVLATQGIDRSVETLRLLYNMQDMHDSDPVSCWPERLKTIAEMYNLKYELNRTVYQNVLDKRWMFKIWLGSSWYHSPNSFSRRDGARRAMLRYIKENT